VAKGSQGPRKEKEMALHVEVTVDQEERGKVQGRREGALFEELGPRGLRRRLEREGKATFASYNGGRPKKRIHTETFAEKKTNNAGENVERGKDKRRGKDAKRVSERLGPGEAESEKKRLRKGLEEEKGEDRGGAGRSDKSLSEGLHPGGVRSLFFSAAAGNGEGKERRSQGSLGYRTGVKYLRGGAAGCACGERERKELGTNLI